MRDNEKQNEEKLLNFNEAFKVIYSKKNNTILPPL
jgi:hypothetical protein